MGFVQQILPRGQHRLNSSVGQQIHRLPSAPVAQQKEAENRQLLARHTAQNTHCTRAAASGEIFRGMES